ncbi:MAG: transglutaminase domain-containing protein, partial [Planctomycetaceae bacterium]|nr:transglutaminase domain-containing protein [Planctomycetaceae bacterium]
MQPSDVQLEKIFRRSIVFVSVGASILAGTAETTGLAAWTAGIAVLVAWILVEWLELFHLPDRMANYLGTVVLIVGAAEFFNGKEESRLLAGVHLLAYLQCIVMLMKKNERRYWWILAISILQVSVGSILSIHPEIGGGMAILTFFGLWCLSVFSLRRVVAGSLDAWHTAENVLPAAETSESPGSPTAANTNPAAVSGSQRPKDNTAIAWQDGIQRDPGEPWITGRFRAGTVLAFFVSVILSVVCYAAFPRIRLPMDPIGTRIEGTPLTPGSQVGFAGNVELGGTGEILTSRERVLQFRVTDLETDRAVSAEEFAQAMMMPEVRFRGNVLAHYRDGSWSMTPPGSPPSRRDSVWVLLDTDTGRSGKANFRVEVTMDAPVHQHVFAVHPLHSIHTSDESERIVQRRGTSILLWQDLRERSRGLFGQPAVSARTSLIPRTYSFDCIRLDQHPERMFHAWDIPSHVSEQDRRRLVETQLAVARRAFVTADLRDQLPRLCELTDTICRTEPATDGEATEPVADTVCVERIMSHLSSQNGFQYSLIKQRTDRSIDPLEDFVFNTRSGHCEYFASAAVLMLQSQNIPAVLVSGFQGSDVNSVSGLNEVRNSNAHTWVEAYVNGRWITLDPTPGEERAAATSGKSGGSLLSDLRFAFADFWVSGTQNMTAERWQAMFRPVGERFHEIRRQIAANGFWPAVKSWVTGTLMVPEKWFSWQGGLATFVILSALVGISRLPIVRRFLATLLRFRDLFSVNTDGRRSIIRFYSRFIAACEHHGLRFPASSTALENATLAIRFFETQLSGN